MAETRQVLQLQEGKVAPSGFSGNPKVANVTFTIPFIDNNYAVNITSQLDGRSWLAENLTPTGFQINSQANTLPIGLVFWTAQHID